MCRREFPSDIKKREEEEKRKKDEQVQYIKNFDNKCNIGDMTAWINTFAPRSKYAFSSIENDLHVIQINKMSSKVSENIQS